MASRSPELETPYVFAVFLAPESSQSISASERVLSTSDVERPSNDELQPILMMLRGDRSVRAELIERNVRELRRLDAEMKELRTEIRRAVEAAGTSLDHVVSVTTYLKSREDAPAYNEVYRSFFPNDPPAR